MLTIQKPTHLKEGKTYVQELGIDLVDDLQMTRQQVAQHANRPAFQSFWQHGMVRVGESSDADVVRLR